MQKRVVTMMKRLMTITLVLVLAAAIGSCKKKERHAAEVKPGPEIAASLLTLAPETVDDTYTAVGTVVSETQSNLSARIMGHVLDVNVDVGDRVTAGQALVVIDARDIETQVMQAEAGVGQARASVGQAQAGVAQAMAARDQASKALIELDQGVAAAEAGLKMAQAQQELAVKTFRRYEKLYNEKSVSGQEFDQILAQRKTADAAVEQAEKTIQSLRARRPQIDAQIRQAEEVVNQAQQGVEQTRQGVAQAEQGVAQTKIMRGFATVSAPYDGVIVKRLVEPGQLAAPGMPLLIIENDAQFRLEVSVDESRIAGIEIGDPVQVKIDALNKTLDGLVHDITPSADAASRSFKVKISLPDIASLHSGMYGRALFNTGRVQKLLVPRDAVVSQGGTDGVFVVGEKKIARFRVIKHGGYDERGRAEVFSGLSAGEAIVGSNARGMVDGARVRER